MTKISIAVRERSWARELVFTILVIGFAVAAGWSWYSNQGLELTAKFAVCAITFLILAAFNFKSAPLILINKNGVYDRRLGVGQIPWSDIIGVQVGGSYGQRLLCLRVKASDRYVNRIRGSKRKRARDRHELGFKQFVIDLGNVNLDLLDLKLLIERRIAG